MSRLHCYSGPAREGAPQAEAAQGGADPGRGAEWPPAAPQAAAPRTLHSARAAPPVPAPPATSRPPADPRLRREVSGELSGGHFVLPPSTTRTTNQHRIE